MQLILTLPTDHIKYTFDAAPVNKNKIVKQEWVSVPLSVRPRLSQLSEVACPTPSLLSTFQLGAFPWF